MVSTKATAGKTKFKRVGSATETDDDLDKQPSRKKLFDFSDGRFSLTLTIFQIISLCLFIGGIAWFLAAEWRFEVKTVNLKNELEQKFSQFKSDYEEGNRSKLNILEKGLNDIENSLNNLKVRNPYLK